MKDPESSNVSLFVNPLSAKPAKWSNTLNGNTRGMSVMPAEVVLVSLSLNVNGCIILNYDKKNVEVTNNNSGLTHCIPLIPFCTP